VPLAELGLFSSPACTHPSCPAPRCKERTAKRSLAADESKAAAALRRIVMKSRRHVTPLPRQLAQQLLRNAYDVVFTVIQAR
jgi:hypothetical protein